MNCWHFYDSKGREVLDRDGSLNIVLSEALKAKTSPSQSGYHVRGAGMLEDGFTVTGGNLEYRLGKALHTEESIAGHALQHSEHGRLILIALIVGEAGQIASPCGNCRDILRASMHPEDKIVSGAEIGSEAKVLRLGEYLFPPENAEKFDVGNERRLLDSIRTLRALNRRFTNDIYGSNRSELDPQKYAVLLTLKNGLEIVGTRQVFVDYHPLMPTQSAINQLRERKIPPIIERVVYVADDVLPDVTYVERQHLLETLLIGKAVSGKELSPDILLVNLPRDENYPADVRVTHQKNWLPYPFNPEHLGLMDAISQKARQMYVQ